MHGESGNDELQKRHVSECHWLPSFGVHRSEEAVNLSLDSRRRRSEIKELREGTTSLWLGFYLPLYALEAGFHLPLDAFMCELLNAYGVAPGQLS
ncbi:hypothetical protein PVK06_026658 [Gossypium arboreum]|uniref:Uncharacterized protein n=1 Tax=Gossypium arboreum TaxID=29729 RepID=A0ABR0P146_GOSAR|nr:hypothetical protein PVK06_026658 [Gossypium arboreum]